MGKSGRWDTVPTWSTPVTKPAMLAHPGEEWAAGYRSRVVHPGYRSGLRVVAAVARIGCMLHIVVYNVTIDVDVNRADWEVLSGRSSIC